MEKVAVEILCLGVKGNFFLNFLIIRVPGFDEKLCGARIVNRLVLFSGNGEMRKRTSKPKAPEVKIQDFVVVTYAKDWDQAKDYETLLKSNDIPALIKEPDHSEDSEVAGGIAVMVAEDCIDEAHVVIESQDAYDDFYDLAIEDEDENEFDAEFYEDEL